MVRRPLLAVALLALLTPVVTAVPSAGAASTGPAGFSDALVLSLPTPTAMAWTPDGRMLLTQKTGEVRVVRDGVLKPAPALVLGSRLCTNGERGLEGMVIDPAFATNHYVYLFWTHNRYGSCATASSKAPRNRVARYVLGDNDLINPASEKVLVDWIRSPAAVHIAGDLQFGADGLLYISTGDGGCTIGDPTRCAALNTNSRGWTSPTARSCASPPAAPYRCRTHLPTPPELATAPTRPACPPAPARARRPSPPASAIPTASSSAREPTTS